MYVLPCCVVWIEKNSKQILAQLFMQLVCYIGFADTITVCPVQPCVRAEIMVLVREGPYANITRWIACQAAFDAWVDT